jgi:pimeloyl-ACP methyl ester carboxylesterase
LIQALTTTNFRSFDGTELALHSLGAGRPVLLLHGLFSSAEMNWLKFGHAALLAEAGYACFMPDWRAHGSSAAPRDAAAYPTDVLVRDTRALVEGLGLVDYDLAGFSLGARTAASAVIAGLTPRRLVLAGMGIDGLSNWERRSAFFVDMIDRFDTIAPGDRAYLARQFLKGMGTDRVAARLLLTQGVCDIAESDLMRITMPTLVLTGSEDRDNGSPEALAAALPDARLVEVPGTHMSCVTKPDLGRAIADFLTQPALGT